MITYGNLVEKAKNDLPEFALEYDNLLKKDYIDQESGNHIVFSYVFTPVLLNAIKKANEETIRRMFDFLEKMSCSNDSNVLEVCDQSVLEVLNDEIEDDELLQYMGVKTKEGFKVIKGYMY